MRKEALINFFDLYSDGKFSDAVNRYFFDNASFWTTRISLEGKQQIIDWLCASHRGYTEKLKPINIVMDGENAAIELEQQFVASDFISHFFIRPLKKQEVLNTRGIFVFVTFKDNRIQSYKEYRLLYSCDPSLFMSKN